MSEHTPGSITERDLAKAVLFDEVVAERDALREDNARLYRELSLEKDTSADDAARHLKEMLALRAEVGRLRVAIASLPTWANRNFDLVAEDHRKVTDWVVSALAGKEVEG